MAVVVLPIMFVLGSFLAQEPQPSATPSPSVSPTVSPSPTPSATPTPTPTPLPGAQNFHQWGSITVFNGLPSDSVRAIAQTHDGVMWFGTDNGLARFDGRRVQNFSIGEGEAVRITTLKTSPNGELWIATRAGAFIYIDNHFQPIERTQGLGITAILLAGGEYLGTDNGLVMRVGRGEGSAYTAEPMMAEAIRAADGNALGITGLIESDGRILAGTSGGGVIAIENGTASELASVPRPVFVNSLVRDGSGKLWLGADAARGATGIYSIHGERATRVAAPTANVLALDANDSGVWAGTERYGLFHIADGKLKKTYTFANTSGGLRSDNIFTLFTDREGVLWIGTNRGVSRFDRLGPEQQTVSDIPNSNFIRTLSHYGEGRTKYAGSNRGLYEFNREEWYRKEAVGDRTIYAIDWITQDPESPIVGAPDGLFDVNGRQLLQGDVRDINYFQGKTYVAVYGRGVVDITDLSRPRLVFSHEAITCLGGYAGRMWIGTSGTGLYSFDGNTVKLEASTEILKSGAIWNVWEAGLNTGALIAGQHGVFFLRSGLLEQIVSAEDVRDVWGVQEGPGDNLIHVWAATTSRGVIHARKDVRFGWIIGTIGFEQGLPSEKSFALLPTKDGLLIASNRGVVMYKGGYIAPKIIPTRVLSQRVHDLTELASKIELEYPQNSLVLEVAGQSSRTFPEEFQYAFVLKNAKGDEVARQLSNDAQYAPADLKPGDYAIEAIAFNRDLVASEPLTIRFSVGRAPFPWTATALAVLLAIAVAGLVWAIYEHRRIRQRNRELAAARLDLANEAERERRRIARDLHDQTLADLRNLMIRSDKGVLSGTEFREEIESVSTEIRRICEDLSPSVLENVGLVAALDFLLTHTVDNHRFSADEGVEERIDFPLNVQLQIYRIAQEVLANIHQHSDARLVEMKIATPEDEKFLLSIRDDGKSFHPDGSVGKGRGIANIRSRASLINAKVAWKESRQGGNVFTLHVGS